MINYLYSIKESIHDIADPYISAHLFEELNLYISLYIKFHKKKEFCNGYSSIPNHYDMQSFYFDTNESIAISWDTDKLNQYAVKHKKITYMTLSNFNNTFKSDILNTRYEFQQIFKTINSVHKHSYTALLTMNFYPTDSAFIIDGRHRYVEYLKFKPACRIPIYTFTDIECVSSIFYKRDLITYIILYNIKIMYDYLNDDTLFERLLKLKDFI